MSRIRCAIYTRKSSDEGLEQDFNSLDAQREACEAYIKSQTGEGWQLNRTRYDDGGLSGGTMDRPALQRLLADIRARQVDAVVVYKVDRLTRSLADFAKIVEVFDAQGVSFVSITQQFSTTTSMGRLTLNMLLTFAQFEREVTAERIRDKVAASKMKGMWMGGPVPLGYDSQDKKLVVNPVEAEVVRKIFALYLEQRSVDLLKREADRLGLVTKRRADSNGIRGGLPFSRGNLYQMLHNAIYVGEIPHNGTTYPGQHEGIIDRGTWDAVQQALTANARERRSPTNVMGRSILTGKLFDETGDRLSPTAANKAGKRHRYYVSQRLLRKPGQKSEGWRIPAGQLEQAIAQGVATLLADPVRLSTAVPALSSDATRQLLRHASKLASHLAPDRLHDSGEALSAILHRVTISTNCIRIEISCRALLRKVGAMEAQSEAPHDGVITTEFPAELRRRGIEAKLVLQTGAPASRDDKLIALVARSHRWLDLMTSGAACSIRQIARADGLDEADVSRFLPLAFLAPDIVEKIVTSRQPTELTAEALKRACPLPNFWNKQPDSITKIFAIRRRHQRPPQDRAALCRIA